MPRKSPEIKCSDKEIEKLTKIINSRSEEIRIVERAKIIINLVSGKSVKETAELLNITSNMVIEWRKRFEKTGVEGLNDKPRTGKPSIYGEEFRNKVLKILENKPPDGYAVWDGLSIAKELNSSVHAVWRVLRKEGISLQRHRSWCVSTDPEFASKAADIIGLYLNPPQNAVVFSIDEKPGIQALERSTGYVYTSNGKIVRGFKSTYKRNGTLNLFAALEISTGAIHTKTTNQKRRVEFLEFMNDVVKDISGNKEIHVILDNYCIHKKNNEWLKEHSNVFFHYTPTSASWLNQVEIWFGIMSRKALRGASFKNIEELRKAIEAFVSKYSESAKPFVWRKREVKGSQLKNTIVNLCN